MAENWIAWLRSNKHEEVRSHEAEAESMWYCSRAKATARQNKKITFFNGIKNFPDLTLRTSTQRIAILSSHEIYRSQIISKAKFTNIEWYKIHHLY
ncbi:unnamed protein product [Brugia pahangi]|uniref:DUF4379 domain-containing protein n=1 Tax=Brugia pahangi TaxID=6280 RepID=A0A0N4SWL1_BRUPA|nr:unnamed protein product [Brugia pahangi]